MLKNEWKHLVKNKLMLIVVIAVITIPTIYTTLFLGSMWDPYGNVDQLPVAVVNNDRPVDYEGETLNVGQEMVDQLKDDGSLDFRFVDGGDARQGLADGDYYMVITIPENFSANAASLTGDAPEKMELGYETNPGTNYIASKMSETAMKTIEASVRESVTKTYVQAVYDQIGVIGDGMQEAADGTGELQDGAVQLKDGNATMTDGLQTLADSTLTFVNGSEELTEGLASYVDGVSTVNDGAQSLNDGAQTLNSGAQQVNDGAQSLNDGVQTLNDGTQTLADGAQTLNGGIQSAKGGSAALVSGTQQVDDKIDHAECGSDAALFRHGDAPRVHCGAGQRRGQRSERHQPAPERQPAAPERRGSAERRRAAAGCGACPDRGRGQRQLREAPHRCGAGHGRDRHHGQHHEQYGVQRQRVPCEHGGHRPHQCEPDPEQSDRPQRRGGERADGGRRRDRGRAERPAQRRGLPPRSPMR